MARTEVTLTDSWQQVATGRCSIEVKDTDGEGLMIALNDAAADTAALVRRAEPGHQFVQSTANPTYAKGDGINIIVDTE